MIRRVAMLALGAALAGCSGLNLGSLGGGSSGGVTVRVESNPAGAEARTPSGATCRTPCALELPANGLTNITFTLQGYLPHTVAVSVTSSREGADLPDAGIADQTRIDPNPVFAQLELAPPPPPPPRRKPAKRKPAVQAAPQQQPQPTPGFGPPQQQQQPTPGFGPPQQQRPAPGFGPPQQQQPGFR